MAGNNFQKGRGLNRVKWGKVLPILKEQDTSFESINVKLKSQNLSVLDIGGRETCLDKNQGNLLKSI